MCITTLSRDNCWIPTMLASIFPWKCGNKSLQKGAKQLLGLQFLPGLNLLPYLNRIQKEQGSSRSPNVRVKASEACTSFILGNPLKVPSSDTTRTWSREPSDSAFWS